MSCARQDESCSVEADCTSSAVQSTKDNSWRLLAYWIMPFTHKIHYGPGKSSDGMLRRERQRYAKSKVYAAMILKR
jgi:hypothetical protein